MYSFLDTRKCVLQKCGIRISKIRNKKSNTMKRKRINQNRLEQYNLELREIPRENISLLDYQMYLSIWIIIMIDIYHLC